MIVDGICIQFLGSFDSRQTNRTQMENQQISGVGRICLDEDYYRELSSKQVKIHREFRTIIKIVRFLFFRFHSTQNSPMKSETKQIRCQRKSSTKIVFLFKKKPF